jgi:uncharacterized membrane protein
MKNKARFLGHPIHPVIVVFPVALFTSSVVFDVLYLITRNPDFPTVAFFMIGTGILSGLLAAVFGVIDWLGLPPRSRSWNFALGHGVGNVLAVMLFTLNWILRRGSENFLPDGRMLTLSFAGVAIILFTAWLGGELVYRLGVGVDPDANIDASNSLTKRSDYSAEVGGLPKSRRP